MHSPTKHKERNPTFLYSSDPLRIPHRPQLVCRSESRAPPHSFSFSSPSPATIKRCSASVVVHAPLPPLVVSGEIVPRTCRGVCTDWSGRGNRTRVDCGGRDGAVGEFGGENSQLGRSRGESAREVWYLHLPSFTYQNARREENAPLDDRLSFVSPSSSTRPSSSSPRARATVSVTVTETTALAESKRSQSWLPCECGLCGGALGTEVVEPARANQPPRSP